MSRRKEGLSTAELRALSALRRAGREAAKALYADARAQRSEGATRDRYARQAERASARAMVERDRADRWSPPEASQGPLLGSQEAQEAQEAPEASQGPLLGGQEAQEGPEAPAASQEAPASPWPESGDWIQPSQDATGRPPESLFEPATSRYGESKAMRPEVIAQGDIEAVQQGIDRIQQTIGHSLLVPGGTLYLPNGEAVKVPTEVAIKGGEAVAEWVSDQLVNLLERDWDIDEDDWYYEVDELRYAY